MKRALPLLLAILLLAPSKAAAPFTLSLRFTRDTLDLLDPVAIQLIVDNPSSRRRAIAFGTANEYNIEIYDGRHEIWHSPTQSPPPANGRTTIHTRSLQPGASIFVTYIWNALDGKGATPAQGQYRVEAQIGGVTAKLRAVRSLRFIAPLSLSAVPKLPQLTPVTVSGRLSGDLESITDATGSLRLDKRLLGARPGSCVAVRGSIVKTREKRSFAITRWAPIRADGRAHDCAPVTEVDLHRSR